MSTQTKRIIALDGGTTNTRLSLMEDGKIIDRVKLKVGIRDGKEALSKALKDGIASFMADKKLTSADIEAIVASGMVTSELGLYTVAHTVAPAGRNELAANAVRVTLGDITDIPFVFVPGVKTFADANMPLAEMDIMRGEEAETVAILDRMGLTSGTVTLILPGSHMKIVNCENGRIVRFSTTLSGELARAAAENTILKNTIGDAFFRDVKKDALADGYALAEDIGVAAALFKLRVAGNFAGKDTETLYSMLLGIILHDDVKAVVRAASGTVIVGGSDPFRTAYLTLLQGKAAKVREVPEELAENAAAYGAWAVTE